MLTLMRCFRRSLAALAIFGALMVPLVAFASVSAAPDPGGGSGSSSSHPTAKAGDCNVPYAKLDKSNCTIIAYIIIATNALSAVAGVVIAASIVGAGIQYSAAGSNPQQVAAARKRLVNSVLALFVFAFGYAVVQWLVPGGVI